MQSTNDFYRSFLARREKSNGKCQAISRGAALSKAENGMFRPDICACKYRLRVALYLITFI